MGTVKEEIAKNLLFFRKQRSMTQRELAARLGVKHNAVSSWESGRNSVDIETLLRICEILGVSVNDVYGAYADQDALTPGERLLIRGYRALDPQGREMVDTVLALERRRAEAARAAEGAVEAAQASPAAGEQTAPAAVTPIGQARAAKAAEKIIPLMGNSFAAGQGEPDFGNLWSDHAVPADSPAQFAIRINGDSMEPWLPDGSIAYGRKAAPQDGDVAALLLDGEFLCKQVCQDHVGNIYLFSLNRARADADTVIWAGSGRNLMCFGTILMEKRLPLPAEIS